jgi:DNA-binding NarL/FixJ family response regulator
MRPIRVILAEDHTVVRAGLRALLDKSEKIKVVAEAEDGNEAFNLATTLRPNVVVMDISMPNLNGIEATRRIKEKYPDINIVILTVHANEAYIFQALSAGAEGYLVKQTAPEDLVAAVEAAAQGEAFLSPLISKSVMENYVGHTEDFADLDSLNSLTKREREVLQLIAEGLTTRKIAIQLFVSQKTIRTHRANMMRKLDLQGTAALTLYALSKGLISLPE